MTPMDVDALGLGPHLRSPRILHFPLGDGRWSWLCSGLSADFQGGSCRRLRAWLGIGPRKPPLFKLWGQVLNGMNDSAFAALLEAQGATPEVSSGSVKAVELGIGASKWESSDDFFTVVEVHAPGVGSADLPADPPA